MLKRLASIGALTLAATGLSIITLPSPAHADGGCGAVGTCPADGDTPTSEGGTVTVTVTGTMVKGGSAGSPGSTTVSVPTPCSYIQGRTGKEYYEDIEGGEALGRNADGSPKKPNPGYEKHKNDTKGRWYSGMCSSADYEDRYGEQDDLDDFFDYSDRWFEENGAVFVEPGEEPPVPPIPPQVLRFAAEEALEVPEPEFDHNPDRDAYPATIVNLPTWFWMTDRTFTGEVTASAGGNSATVQAGMQDFSVASSAGDSTGPCADGGTPWTTAQPADAAGDCSITFAAAAEGLALTATSTWGLSWSYNGQPRGQLDPVSATWTDQVTVGEVQSVVDDVG